MRCRKACDLSKEPLDVTLITAPPFSTDDFRETQDNNAMGRISGSPPAVLHAGERSSPSAAARNDVVPRFANGLEYHFTVDVPRLHFGYPNPGLSLSVDRSIGEGI